MADAQARVNFAFRDPLSTLFQFSLSFSTFAILTAIFTKTSLHIIPEGSVGVYWRGGSLLTRVTQPGLRLRIPFLDRYEAISVVRETTQITNTSCATKGGVVLPVTTVEVIHEFDQEYVYRTIKKYGEDFVVNLVRNQIRREIGSWCISRSINEVFDTYKEAGSRIKESLSEKVREAVPGLTIVDVYLGSPEVPSYIQTHFLELERHRLEGLVAEQKLKVARSNWEYEFEKGTAEARQEVEKEQVLLELRLENKKLELKLQKIENEIMMERENALAEAQKFSMLMEAEGNRELLTREYLQLKLISLLGSANMLGNLTSLSAHERDMLWTLVGKHDKGKK